MQIQPAIGSGSESGPRKLRHPARPVPTMRQPSRIIMGMIAISRLEHDPIVRWFLHDPKIGPFTCRPVFHLESDVDLTGCRAIQLEEDLDPIPL